MEKKIEIVGTADVSLIKENEDGSATYTFQMSDEVAEEMQSLGLKLILYCGVTQVDLQDVFNWVLEQGKEQDATHNA